MQFWNVSSKNALNNFWANIYWLATSCLKILSSNIKIKEKYLEKCVFWENQKCNLGTSKKTLTYTQLLLTNQLVNSLVTRSLEIFIEALLKVVA